ncbi:MAG: hypothetical protein HZB38_03745 [Planctomycetes bacterium]|nr:hypothetical protein [Planctomycetota bacterium]
MKIRNLAVLAGSLVLVGAAFADNEQVGDRIRFYDAAGTLAGEFGIDNLTQTSLADFRTFCVERRSYMDFDSRGFNVVGVTDRAMPQNDQISAQTAYLYSQFRAGTLSNYSYGGSRTASADELQEAIWRLEGELSGANGQAAAWIAEANAAVATGGSWYDQWGNGAGGYDGLNFLGNVRVLNLTWGSSRNGHYAGENAQDQLTLIPAPGAALLGAIGLALLRSLKRRA